MEAEPARIAAKWWADRMREGVKLDNGKEPEALMAQALGYALRHQVPHDRIDEFEDHLCTILLARDDSWGFGVDYHPSRELAEALTLAGIPVTLTVLPWKTTMWATDQEVRVRHGYGAPEEVLWPKRVHKDAAP